MKKIDKFDISEGGATKYYHLTRESDGREFTYVRSYDANLDVFDDSIEAPDGKPITKEEEEAVKKAVQEFFQK